MFSLHYKGRIHKSKLSLRGIRYVLSDQAARAFPTLQQRWLFPVESRPIAEAAAGGLALPSATIGVPVPEPLVKLAVPLADPLQSILHIYSLEDAVVTGWAGAMMKDGLLMAITKVPNWASHLRARTHALRELGPGRPYFNLMCPIPARGHIFHWLFESVVPLLAFLKNGGSELGLGLLVNAKRSGIQQVTLDYLKARHGIGAVEALGAGDAVRVPDLRAAVAVPHDPLALKPAAGIEMLTDFGQFIARDTPESGFPKRIYISRNDARLRRVSNEDRLMAILESRGFTRVTLGGMPMARQVQHFRQAEAIVAPHGAGLAHLAWCKPGTKAIEFFPGLGGPRGRVRNATANMWLIAQQRELDYRCYFAGPPETRDDAFTIPEELMIRALGAAEIG
jgi:Glycosyltransferase 61